MASLNQIASKYASVLRQPTNHELRERIKDAFRFTWASRVRQSIQKEGVSELFSLTFDVNLILVDSIDSCIADANCKILRTENTIPTPLRYPSDSLFEFVGTVGDSPFMRVNSRRAYKAMKLRRFFDNVIMYTYEKRNSSEYIYILGTNKIKFLRIVEITTDIEHAISTCTNPTCYSDDAEFPCTDDMIQSIGTEILKTEFGLINPKVEEVEINNDRPDISKK